MVALEDTTAVGPDIVDDALVELEKFDAEAVDDWSAEVMSKLDVIFMEGAAETVEV